MRCKKVQKLLKSRCKFCTRIFRVCYTYVMHIFAYVTDIVSGVFFAHVMHILRACYAYSSRILGMHYVWCAYSSCMLRVSSRMLRVFFAHVTPILRKCPQTRGGGGGVGPFAAMHFWNVNSNPDVLYYTRETCLTTRLRCIKLLACCTYYYTRVTNFTWMEVKTHEWVL